MPVFHGATPPPSLKKNSVRAFFAMMRDNRSFRHIPVTIRGKMGSVIFTIVFYNMCQCFARMWTRSGIFPSTFIHFCKQNCYKICIIFSLNSTHEIKAASRLNFSVKNNPFFWPLRKLLYVPETKLLSFPPFFSWVRKCDVIWDILSVDFFYCKPLSITK